MHAASPTPTKFRSLPTLSPQKQADSPLRRVFLDLEEHGLVDGDGTGTAQVQRLDFYQSRVKKLEEQLFEVRSNSMPLRSYRELTQELANECRGARKSAEDQVAVHFQLYIDTMDELTKERDCALDRVNVLETQLSRCQIGLDEGQAAHSRAKMLESELQASLSSVEVLVHRQGEDSRLADDLRARIKKMEEECRHHEQARDKAETELRTRELDIAKLKSVIKVATDSVRKAAEQRQTENVLRSLPGGDSSNLSALSLQVLSGHLEEREDWMHQLRESKQREVELEERSQRAEAGEAEARRQLAKVRQDLEDLRAKHLDLQDELQTMEAKRVLKPQDAECDSNKSRLSARMAPDREPRRSILLDLDNSSAFSGRTSAAEFQDGNRAEHVGIESAGGSKQAHSEEDEFVRNIAMPWCRRRG